MKNIQIKNIQFNVLTHCNAGWLATVDWGTALSPIYKAHRLELIAFGLVKQDQEIKVLILQHLN